MERVAPRFRDDADLAPGAGAKLCRIAIRLDAEFLDVFQTALQSERGCKLAANDARRRIDDAGAVNAIVANGILVHRSSVETNVVECSRTGVLRARRLQIQLR